MPPYMDPNSNLPPGSPHGFTKLGIPKNLFDSDFLFEMNETEGVSDFYIDDYDQQNLFNFQ
jgi:hypothetical protein